MFEYSFAAILRLRPEVLRKLRIVKFEGEDVLDYGGISREWSFLLEVNRSGARTVEVERRPFGK